MWPNSIPPLSSVKRKELSKRLSAYVCVVCVCILASCEELCPREKNNYHTPSSRNCSLHRRERNSDAPTAACRPDGHLQSRPSQGRAHLCRWHVSHGGHREEENETRYVHNKEFLSCGMLLSAPAWVSWLHLQLDNNAEPFEASFRSDSVAWLFPRAALITRPLAHARSRRVII